MIVDTLIPSPSMVEGFELTPNLRLLAQYYSSDAQFRENFDLDMAHTLSRADIVLTEAETNLVVKALPFFSSLFSIVIVGCEGGGGGCWMNA